MGMQLGHHPGVVLTQRPASVDQDPQDRELFVVDHRTKPGHPGPDQRHGVGIGDVGLASLTGRKHPDPRRELRRDIDDFFADRQESHRDVVTDPVAALDRPDTVLTARPGGADVTHHRGEPGLVGVEPATTHDDLVRGHHLDRDRPLVRVHPDHHTVAGSAHPGSSVARSITGLSSREGNATSSWADPS